MISHNGHSYKIFDMHTHAFPDAIASRAVDALAHNAGIVPYADGTFAGLQAYERNADKFLLLPIATKPQQTHALNHWAAQHQRGKALCFGSVHPDSQCLADELDEIVALGLRGIKFHPDYQHFFIDDERHYKLYEMIFARGLHMIFHSGVDLAFPPPFGSTPLRLKNLCAAFPNEKIISAHMGGYLMEREGAEILSDVKNLWLDTAYATSILPNHELLEFARAHGTDKVLFATDSPWTDFDAAVSSVLNAGFTHEEIQNILYDNAAKLMGVD